MKRVTRGIRNGVLPVPTQDAQSSRSTFLLTLRWLPAVNALPLLRSCWVAPVLVASEASLSPVAAFASALLATIAGWTNSWPLALAGLLPVNWTRERALTLTGVLGHVEHAHAHL